MDKNRIMNDEKTNCDVHAIPPGCGMHEIHRKYGLWIIRSHSGSSRKDSFYKRRDRYFEYYAAAHMYEGAGRLQLRTGESFEVRPGDCVVVTPGTVHRYGGVNGKCFVEDSVNFCGPVADMLAASGVIANGVFPFDRVRRLLPVIERAADPSVDSQIMANIELQKILVELYLNRKQAMNFEYPLVEGLLLAIREDPRRWWTVKEMAEMCNLSEDQLRRVFLARTGFAPKIYVDRLKLFRAAEFLAETGVSVSAAAERFGYRDPYHFSRRFKDVTGMPPGRYRALFSVRDKNA